MAQSNLENSQKEVLGWLRNDCSSSVGNAISWQNLRPSPKSYLHLSCHWCALAMDDDNQYDDEAGPCATACILGVDAKGGRGAGPCTVFDLHCA